MSNAAPREVIRYLDQIVEYYDPAFGLGLPERLAYVVSLVEVDPAVLAEEPEATWRARFTALLRDPQAPRLRWILPRLSDLAKG